ncbi:unnamed protein product [Sphagnum balticum]
MAGKAGGRKLVSPADMNVWLMLEVVPGAVFNILQGSKDKQWCTLHGLRCCCSRQSIMAICCQLFSLVLGSCIFYIVCPLCCVVHITMLSTFRKD